MNDLDIINNSEMIEISKLCNDNDIDNYYCYGKYIAKLDNNKSLNKNGKLILVSAISPTKYGEGKTTVSIGLIDGLNKIGKNCCGVLREPSLGPVFGIKGGACGGGKSQLNPMVDINLHFTGDFHAISQANNLLVSSIYNHIYFGNKLGIKKITFKRCLDINDRSLRDDFNICAASEVMTILCVSNNIHELKENLGNIIVGYNEEDKEIYARDLKVEGAMAVLLKDAIKPNLVQTLENNLVLVHSGPFANISIGTSSITSIKKGLDMFDYVVTEAGFGSDLGAEKFLNIMCRNNDIKPGLVVLVVTSKAVKVNGLENIKVHVENLRKFNVNVVVAINKFDSDLDSDIDEIKNYCDSLGVNSSVTTSYKDGSNGSIELANLVVDNIGDNDINFTYDIEDKLSVKIEKVCKEIYHAGNIIYKDNVIDKIKYIEDNNINYPICVCKTQYSISDDKNKLGYPKDYDITVKDIEIMNGAKLIVVKLNDIVTMPGLPEVANYENIDIDNEGNIKGIF